MGLSTDPLNVSNYSGRQTAVISWAQGSCASQKLSTKPLYLATVTMAEVVITIPL